MALRWHPVPLLSSDDDSSLGEVCSSSCASYRSVIDESEYHDARSDLPRKVTFGRHFHLKLDWNRLSDDDKGLHIPMDYLRTGEVNHFLSQESYVDLLGFIPHRPEFDSYVFAMREIELFRDAMADPSVYPYEGDLFVDALPYSSPNGGVYQDETGELYTMDPVDRCLYPVYRGHNWNQYMFDQLDTDRQNTRHTSEQAFTDLDSTDPPVVHANWFGYQTSPVTRQCSLNH
jgi:hypothetical protein